MAMTFIPNAGYIGGDGTTPIADQLAAALASGLKLGSQSSPPAVPLPPKQAGE